MGCCGSKDEDEQGKRDDERTPLLNGGNGSIQGQSQPIEQDDASEGRAQSQNRFVISEAVVAEPQRDAERDLAEDLRDLTIRTEKKLIMTIDDRDGELCWAGQKQRLQEYRQWLDALDLRAVKLNTPASMALSPSSASPADTLSQTIRHAPPDIVNACAELQAVSDLASNFVFSEPVITELDSTMA